MNAWRRAWMEAGWGGVASAAAIVGAVVVVAFPLWALVRAWRLPAPEQLGGTGTNTKGAEAYAASFDAFKKQLDGRSLLYTPSKPGTEEVVEVADQTDPSQPAPAKYDGPAISAIVLDSVWFADGQRLKAGGDASGDLKVISTNAPWGAKVRWRGAEFDVSFFERDKTVIKGATVTPVSKPAGEDQGASKSSPPGATLAENATKNGAVKPATTAASAGVTTTPSQATSPTATGTAETQSSTQTPTTSTEKNQ